MKYYVYVYECLYVHIRLGKLGSKNIHSILLFQNIVTTVSVICILITNSSAIIIKLRYESLLVCTSARISPNNKLNSMS